MSNSRSLVLVNQDSRCRLMGHEVNHACFLGFLSTVIANGLRNPLLLMGDSWGFGVSWFTSRRWFRLWCFFVPLLLIPITLMGLGIRGFFIDKNFLLDRYVKLAERETPVLADVLTQKATPKNTNPSSQSDSKSESGPTIVNDSAYLYYRRFFNWRTAIDRHGSTWPLDLLSLETSFAQQASWRNSLRTERMVILPHMLGWLSTCFKKWEPELQFLNQVASSSPGRWCVARGTAATPLYLCKISRGTRGHRWRSGRCVEGS